MESDRERIERLKVDPANVAAQLVALTSVSDWARGMHRENFDGYLIAAAELLTRPTPDGEIGELVERLRDNASLMEAATPFFSCVERMRQAADHLETQAADIARLREAEARVLSIIENGYPNRESKTGKTSECPHGRFYYEDCIACYDEALLAALATRTDVR